MWIARDKDGSLWIYEDKPIRDEVKWVCKHKSHLGFFSEIVEFPPFSNVTWENSPQELIIKPEEK